jgi:hypothetical protein
MVGVFAGEKNVTSPSTTSQGLLLVVVALLTVTTCMAGLARRAAEMGPGVGDIVAFKPGVSAPFGSPARLIASRPEKESCVLDVGMIQQSGGSLVVEQRGVVAGTTYRAHWAGPRTSEDATNCGPEADLELSKGDLNLLAISAGGPTSDQPLEMRLR